METPVSFTPPFTSDNCTVVVTEWRNEPSNSVRLSTIYIMRVNKTGFTIGHQPFDVAGHDAPTFAWIASTNTQ